ncbi:MAG: ImmA/IrrE family metallo-endopeptidase [Melioribacteraceae bacterium]|nr:ImmA/IrrE family metallo-endopeptidase [Melioribacteraceae bacterium]MCF8353841.1 ImmA/IrrE family metallo-endopeptidase [Melioribacteraceae bacterium]MCF8393074.1 ImmA/IrrE family metallo-endopeptidase [Melioribacteraceae bacterium]MCF8419193.1 ImmA/IrrE family metallo-endopeptidase [Melioribacteraceae bacterium]
MNTVKIGNTFEDRVYELFSEELINNRLWLNPNYSKIFRKKGYYSRDRGKEIITDISIESNLPHKEHFSALTIIECKNYTHPVPVDDIEEFNSKLAQIAGMNVKGIVVSSNSYQDGAFKYAKSRGIGLVRLFNNDNFQWILTRAATGLVTREQIEKCKNNVINGLSLESYAESYIEFYGFYNDQYTHSASQLFNFIYNFVDENVISDLFVVLKDSSSSFVPYLSTNIIEEKAKNIHTQIGYSSGEVSTNKLRDYIKQDYDIELKLSNNLGIDNRGFEILGKINYELNEISICTNVNSDEKRERFTFAHEIGHYILNHNNYLVTEFYSESDYENNNVYPISIDDIKRLEWQANYFASCLLLPKEHFLYHFSLLWNKEDLKNRGYGILYVDRQQCNLDVFYRLTNELKRIFNVSRKVIEIRLKNLELLNDKR